ncbi:MAG: hypothetical protein AAF962_26985 [Actinomycetota bacterium]
MPARRRASSIDGFDRLPIEQVWDYGPIGYDGEAWLHPRYRVVVAQLDDEGDAGPIIIVPDISKAQYDKLQGLLSRGAVLPDGWERGGGSFKRRDLAVRAKAGANLVVISMSLAPPDLDPSLVIRITAVGA